MTDPAGIGLAAAAAAAGPELVQPPGDRRARVPVHLPLRLEAGLVLGPGLGLALVSDAAGRRWLAPWAAEGAGIRRARAGDGVAAALVGLMADRGPGHHELADGFALECWRAAPIVGERAITADQTNESVVVGGRAIVKWHLAQGRADSEPVPSPVPERLSLLVRAGFRGTAQPWGLLRWSGPGGGQGLAAEVVDHLSGAVDGWEWAVDDVARVARRSIGAGGLEPACELGRLTARMHAALATGGSTPADADGLDAWEQRVRRELAEALEILPDGSRAVLAPRAGALSASYAALGASVGTPLIPVHGDLHVGQVLRWGDPVRYAVIDFEGNPVLSPHQRLLPAPTAVDVAGMLASLDHVGRIVLRRLEGSGGPLVRGWIRDATGSFLSEYRAEAAARGIGGLLDERLLAPLRYAQEVREYLYAVRHLPHWTYVADGALRDLLPDGPPELDRPSPEE